MDVLPLYCKSVKSVRNYRPKNSYILHSDIDLLPALPFFSKIWQKETTLRLGMPRIHSLTTRTPIAFLVWTFFKDYKLDRNLALTFF